MKNQNFNHPQLRSKSQRSSDKKLDFNVKCKAYKAYHETVYRDSRSPTSGVLSGCSFLRKQFRDSLNAFSRAIQSIPTFRKYGPSRAACSKVVTGGYPPVPLPIVRDNRQPRDPAFPEITGLNNTRRYNPHPQHALGMRPNESSHMEPVSVYIELRIR